MIDIFNTGLLFILLFLIYYLFIILILLFISSYVAAITMLIFPIIFLLSIPEKNIAFFTYVHAEFFNEMVVINNLHILLFIWASLFSIIIYTEILSRYISLVLVKQDSLKNAKTSVNSPGESGLKKATVKPVEQIKPGKDNRVLNFLSINEGEAVELIEMASKYRKNFKAMVKEKKTNKNTEVNDND